MFDCGVFIFAFQVSIQVKCPKSGRGSRGRFQNANFYVLTAEKCWARKKVFFYVFINAFVSNCFPFICSRTRDVLGDPMVITLEVVKIEKKR